MKQHVGGMGGHKTRNPNPKNPTPNPKHMKFIEPETISGSKSQNPKFFQGIRVLNPGTQITHKKQN
jgi:hypothetical protein